LSSGDVEKFLADNAPEYERDGDITLSRACEAWSVQGHRMIPRTAMLRLEESVKSGKLICIPKAILKNGKVGKIYRIVKKA